MSQYLANAHSVTSPAGSIYRTSFSDIVPTRKAIVHLIGYLLIKISYVYHINDESLQKIVLHHLVQFSNV